jgi:hypothetical protein
MICREISNVKLITVSFDLEDASEMRKGILLGDTKI